MDEKRWQKRHRSHIEHRKWLKRIHKKKSSLKKVVQKQESSFAKWLAPAVRLSSSNNLEPIDIGKLEIFLEYFLRWKLSARYLNQPLFIDGFKDFQVEFAAHNRLKMHGLCWFGTPRFTELKPFVGNITISNSNRRFRDFAFKISDDRGKLIAKNILVFGSPNIFLMLVGVSDFQEFARLVRLSSL
jgi:hypothetical protein